MRILMCPPDFFVIEKEINKWMKKENQPDRYLSKKQWVRPVQIYTTLEADPWFIEPDPDCQDMCFTANTGWCRWGILLRANFKGAVAEARARELIRHEKWFKDRQKILGLEIVPWPSPSHGFGGQADVVTVGKNKESIILLMGYGQKNRTEYEAKDIIREVHGLLPDQVIPMRLVNDDFYDFDTTCLYVPPFDNSEEVLIYYPGAYDAAGRRVINSLPIDPRDIIAVTDEEAHNFVCNGVFIRDPNGRTNIIMNQPSERLMSILKERGFVVWVVDTSEFLKSGGSVRCLSLFLPDKNWL
ncbi:MAG: hypothetical protein A3H69_03775 [Candidatus Sungbacteria bacterium RIFCSPLOWO2_02_FULL_47_9]|uniref:Amidinotransferase n=1 Tax=Candidatus Sungbacteria bacterium RIFCSPHIGHO2_01_FULL_47_32 TaxID=1802264 RepID=A0A1G2K4S4_9BACT|nr:MAG: Amidinotransferase [Parcubacteria group bacterium GW2011_GWA2_47_10]OGZ94163.1 MAG: hypothetical protein A2633_02855 [Candidatus Sungbacteria bacterium RIFCSPHIGHO2_01_FULL_47_32]OHA06273.1 MAG: hypothetical protein A3A28_02150 [Candidatus Sungbacteria bacterium RIFCSPLOWO2_01_FULL_47_32]OHA11198.1 MAG: hypothetical protein A3H69_03775 [Candidatus Sungbacteria bacterium RIFCSPLOWO2_02_FULL_47_9]